MATIVFKLDTRGRSYSKNIVVLPSGAIAPKYRKDKKYFFDGQVWGWQ